VDVIATADNALQHIPVCPVSGLIQTHHEPIIGVFHQYAHQCTGKTIHYVSQLRHFGTIVDDTPRLFGGKQRIIPLSICSGLPYMDISPPSQEKLDTFPHVFFATDMEWHPQSVNDKYSVADLYINDGDLQHSDYHPGRSDVYSDLIPSVSHHDVHLRMVQPNQPDLDTITFNFGFVPRLRIQYTSDNTTQFTRLDTSYFAQTF
jgi:hypothetical protein